MGFAEQISIAMKDLGINGQFSGLTKRGVEDVARRLAEMLDERDATIKLLAGRVVDIELAARRAEGFLQSAMEPNSSVRILSELAQAEEAGVDNGEDAERWDGQS